MPVAKVPLPRFDSFPRIKKSKELLEMLRSRVQLYVEEKRIERSLKGDKKQGIEGLNTQLFNDLRFAIPKSDVKSIEYEITNGPLSGRFQVSMIVYNEGQKKLDKKLLLTTPFEVSGKCKCGKKLTIETTVPPSLIDECTTEGKVPEPTVSVKRIGEKDSSDGDE